ncbi:hypothetical protein BGW41_003269 [Actinomortierella wolfii]|nr:hypothetical protein BGW41_003269 [Actinomortierella wolfii]
MEPKPACTNAEALTAISATAAVSHERIERYHLLHMTNPTNGKILYNLGLVYDIYLGQPLIASRCYLSAYEKSLIVIPEEQMDQGSGTTTNSAESLSSKGKAVTRINSAWNLGVLYAKDSQWALARDWFLRAQQELTSVSHSSWSDEQTTEIRTNTSSVNNQKEHSLLLAQHQEDSHHTSPVCTDDTRLKAVLALVDRHLIQANVIP